MVSMFCAFYLVFVAVSLMILVSFFYLDFNGRIVNDPPCLLLSTAHFFLCVDT